MCSEKNQTPRVRRRIFTLIAAVSLLLLVANITLIVSSYYYQKGWEKGVRLSRLEALSHRNDIREGRIYFKTTRQSFEQYSAGAEFHLNLQGTADTSYPISPVRPSRGLPDFLGFGRAHGKTTGSAPSFPGTSTLEIWEVWVPIWPAAVLFSILPLAWTRRPLARLLEAKRRSRVGKCANCRYDLMGNTTGVCPECGTPTDAPPPQSLLVRLTFDTLGIEPLDLDFRRGPPPPPPNGSPLSSSEE
jgi:hypothetical protein